MIARGAAGALGDVLAGHLEMDAAGIGALGAVDGEEAPHLAQDGVEAAGSCSRWSRSTVLPCIGSQDHTTDAAFALDGAHQRRQLVADLVGAEAADERQAAGLVLRIEDVDQPQEARPASATVRI